jgi:hypothetical protein
MANAPTTIPKIESVGKTWLDRSSSTSPNRDSLALSISAVPRRVIGLHGPMIHTTNAIDKITPGMTPPMSNLEMEMPESEPNKTVNAEGGINISTAPMAMMGPAAMVGW